MAYRYPKEESEGGYRVVSGHGKKSVTAPQEAGLSASSLPALLV